MEEYLELGQIVNSYGIKGFLKVVPYTDDNTRFNDLETIYIEKSNKLQEYVIEEVKYSKNLVLLKLKGIDTIEQAEKFRNCYLKINRKDAIELEEDTYFLVDLIGIEVFTESGENLGNIIDVFPSFNNIYRKDLAKKI